MLKTSKPTQLTAEIHKENLTSDEQSMLHTLLAKATVPPRPSAWKPTCGEEYWVVTGYGGVCRYTWTDIESDEAYYSMDNCFPTRESAEFAVRRLKVFSKLQQYADEHNSAPIDWRSTQQKWYFMYERT